MCRTSFYYLLLCLSLLQVACQSEPELKVPTQIKQGMVFIPQGTLNMGGDNDQAQSNELPKHKVSIDAFWLDETEVTNVQFEQFIKKTGYVTIAERPIDWEEMKLQLPPDTPKPADSLLLPGSLVFKKPSTQVSLNNYHQWWEWKIGANWQSPQGGLDHIKDKKNHPVVQVAWEDAQAYCKSIQKRLPTEAEWEWAVRGGKENNVYAWGNEAAIEGKPRANFWQGPFPVKNTNQDGYLTTAPVKTYPPNAYGLYDMAGNVWEWCSDWYDYHYYKKKAASIKGTTGPLKVPGTNTSEMYEKVMRGGSFLCAENYCSGYRNSTRQGSSFDTGLNHTGFRCACEID